MITLEKTLARKILRGSPKATIKRSFYLLLLSRGKAILVVRAAFFKTRINNKP